MNKIELKISTVIVISLFVLGMGSYVWALFQEELTREPFYITLSIFGALLTITATFGAIISDWLNK